MTNLRKKHFQKPKRNKSPYRHIAGPKMASKPQAKIKRTPPILEKTIKNHIRCITRRQWHKTTTKQRNNKTTNLKKTARAMIEVEKETASSGGNRKERK